MEVELTQEKEDGRPPCSVRTKIRSFGKSDKISKALADGMTPIISYWGSTDMIWMDGQGKDLKGPCAKDNPDLCTESIQFYGFSIADIEEPTTAFRSAPIAP